MVWQQETIFLKSEKKALYEVKTLIQLFWLLTSCGRLYMWRKLFCLLKTDETLQGLEGQAAAAPWQRKLGGRIWDGRATTSVAYSQMGGSVTQGRPLALRVQMWQKKINLFLHHLLCYNSGNNFPFPSLPGPLFTCSSAASSLHG